MQLPLQKLLKPRRLAYVLVTFAICLIGLGILSRDAAKRYSSLLSVIVYDRNGIPTQIQENAKGHYAIPVTSLPESFKNHLLEKEDQQFYVHLGVNPVRMIRAVVSYTVDGKSDGSSTITEQLAKNILHTENERTLRNKLRELLYAFSMELFMRKDTILTMYANTVYMGNQLQGFETACQAYFGKALSEITPHEEIMLLATLSFPASRNPKKPENEAYARALYTRLIAVDTYVPPPTKERIALQHPIRFEQSSLGITCTETCTTTLDSVLTESLRGILKRMIDKEYGRGVRTGAIVVINPQTEELIALVGSPDPTRTEDGSQINMALEPRPIGSTVKPLIYLKGFIDGLRPYTRVDDREYRYPIATGYALYPKNFDGRYHGEITLHYALSNSLNVPSVKVLEYIGLTDFYSFLTDTLRFKPLQPLDSYQYGIALGGLEMDLLTLTHYISLFPRNGTLLPLRVMASGEPFTTPHAHIDTPRPVAPEAYTELVTAILSDRKTGVEQFGERSNLNLSFDNVAVKTGTSRDFHDSWVVGYTPNLVVGVWVGNAENTELAQVSGQVGAGSVWHDVMEHLRGTSYYTSTPFSFDALHAFSFDDTLEWGLPEDTISEHESLLIQDRLIVSIHEGDVYEYRVHTRIPLEATERVTWSVNGETLSVGTEYSWEPEGPGSYEIEARTESGRREILHITITSPER